MIMYDEHKNTGQPGKKRKRYLTDRSLPNVTLSNKRLKKSPQTQKHTLRRTTRRLLRSNQRLQDDSGEIPMMERFA